MYDQIVCVALDLVRAVRSPVARTVETLLVKQDWAELQQLRVSPRDYTCSESYWRDALCVEFLRKAQLPTTLDLEAKAVEQFRACEAQCCATNARLWKYLPENHLWWPPGKLMIHEELLVDMRKDISNMLRRLPADILPRFSGGATMSDMSREATIPDRMTSTPSVYGHSSTLLPFWWETSWGHVVRDRGKIPIVVRGNSFFTVAKDALNRRGCGKEASINVALQLGFAQHLRTGLRRWGIDLSTAKDLHMAEARAGSVTGHIATIDMSTASDTVARIVPRLLFPEEWFGVLDSLRASHTRVRRRWVLLEKFSSMGNGFTFELETIIFAAIGRAACRKTGCNPDEVRCFGDDLIVPSGASALTRSILLFMGFTVNEKKTYDGGSFRESCGGDYFNGAPVRAVYVEDIPSSPTMWIGLANSLRRSCADIPARWAICVSAWERVLSFIPSDIRKCRGPSHLGDVVIHDHEDKWDRRVGDFDLQLVRGWCPIGKPISLDHWAEDVQLASCTLVESRGVERRGGVTGFKKRWIPSQLTNLWEPPITRSGGSQSGVSSTD